MNKPVPTTLGATGNAFESEPVCDGCIDWSDTSIIVEGAPTGEMWVADVCTVFFDIETDSTAIDE